MIFAFTHRLHLITFYTDENLRIIESLSDERRQTHRKLYIIEK